MIDPYGNVIVQSIFIIRDGKGQIEFIRSARRDPWRFAFIATTTGQYLVEAPIRCQKCELIKDPPPVVGTIKVTVYNK